VYKIKHRLLDSLRAIFSFLSDTFADDAESPVRFATRITGDSKYNAISLDTHLLF
jgi:hypothetical protein